MPEARAAGVFQKIVPPDAMGFRAGPPFKRFEIPPVLAHSAVGWKQAEDKILVEQKAVGFCIDGGLNLWTEAEQSHQATKSAHLHTEVDDYKIRIFGQIYRFAFDAIHRSFSRLT